LRGATLFRFATAFVKAVFTWSVTLSNGPPASLEVPTRVSKRIGYRYRARARRLLLEASLAARRLAPRRMRPSVFVVGAQKAGTTSLHALLDDHPGMRAPLVKEVHYFDLAADRSSAWYEAHFPVAPAADNGTALAFDTTPYYLFHPQAASRIARYDPYARIIVLLRDPVQRAWSHYWHEWRRGFETLEPMDAFSQEALRLPDPHIQVGETSREIFAHQHYSYCARSEYDCQLERWFDCFPRANLLILKSESLFEDPEATLARLADFLKIAPFRRLDSALNVGRYPRPPEAVETWLRDRLAASAESTRSMLGPEFSW
jgi:hypothetical protein